MPDLKQMIRNVPDFPKPGIGFKDITTLLKDGAAFKQSVDELAAKFNPDEIDKILGIESRGFIYAAAMAYKWEKGLILARKAGKLPADKVVEEYELEYGVDRIEIHRDAVSPGERVLIIDDLLATGGTVATSVKLVERLGGQVVGIGFLVELPFLNGRDKLKTYKVYSIISFDSE